MRLLSKSDDSDPFPFEVPSEVQIWINKGWTIIPSERRGYVLSGEKRMRSIDKIGLIVGTVLLLGFLVGFKLLGIIGLILLGLSWLNFKFNTKPQTKFFPLPGEKTRILDRD
ncbi:MAG: hypothetical protein JWM35_769 [Verrucomicrobia bacterium]|nr:hypothetical protein [Verrucomicrobiota bacterium]